MEKGFIRNTFIGFALGALSFGAQANLYEDGLMAYAMGDYAEAGKFLMKAADKGDQGAEHMLMRLYSEDKLKSQDLDEDTLKWTLKAAQKGVMQAQFALAEIYAYQQGEVNLAVTWYRRAAKQGHAQAHYELGMILEKGAQNVSADTSESDRLYSIAASEFHVFAQQGDAGSQHYLANMYTLAQGVERDIEKALGWMKKSALQDYAMAQLSLGQLYAFGDEVPRDTRLAAYWLDRAAAQGLQDAAVMLSELENNPDTNIALLM